MTSRGPPCSSTKVIAAWCEGETHVFFDEVRAYDKYPFEMSVHTPCHTGHQDQSLYFTKFPRKGVCASTPAIALKVTLWQTNIAMEYPHV